MSLDISTTSEDSRYDRAERIAWWDQATLSGSKVMVVGAGAIGNELLKNLSLLGVGTIFVVDTDTIERSNLARCVLFREGDDGKSKAETAAKRLSELNSHIRVVGITADIVWGVGQGLFRRMDAVAGAVDNRLARYFINRSCSMFSIPFVDSGIQELDGTVTSYRSPRSPCYECTLYEIDYRLLTDKYPCFGLLSEDIVEWKTPTVATTASIVAGVQTQEIVKILHDMKGQKLPSSVRLLTGREFRYSGKLLESSTYEISKKHSCFNQFCRKSIGANDLVELRSLTRNHTAKELYEEVSNYLPEAKSIMLGIQILLKGRCRKCGEEQQFYKPEKAVTDRQVKCPECNLVLDLETTSIVPNSDLTLKEMNIPPAYVFQVAAAKSMKFFVVTGDLNESFRIL